MYNSITIVGNLGRDPEIKQTSKGGNYAILSVATHRNCLLYTSDAADE